MRFSHKAGLLACVACITSISAPAAGLTFNITYSSAVQSDGNYAQIQSAVNFVSNEFSSLYSDPITLNFTIDEGSVGLGQSLFSENYYRGSYAQLKSALTSDSKSANDAIAIANLPATDPYSAGCSSCWYATSAEAKALGLITNQSTFDGTYTFDNTVNYTYDPLNRAVAGKYDFIGVTEHEFSELMGRTSQSSGFGYDILDIFRYTAVGVQQPAKASGVYYSFDNGKTNLAGYNAGGGDRQDFDGAVATDPFNAATGGNQAHALTSADISTMDVIGYNLTSSTPEPASFLLALPLFGLGVLKLRKRTQA